MECEPFCIDRSILGTNKSLLKNNDEFAWVEHVPTDAWHLSGRFKPDRCLDTLLALGGTNVNTVPDQKFVNVVSTVSSGSLSTSIVPWRLVMPKRDHRTFLERLVHDVEVALPTLPKAYYEDTWVPGQTVLRSLSRARVDVQAFDELVKAGTGNTHALSTFFPDGQCLTSKVTYNRFGTLTGRLTVSSGPSILTLNRSHRRVLRPLTNGKVVSVDFAALEPRVLLHESGAWCSEQDLYASLAKEFSKDRKSIKGAVLAELYGSSKRALGEAINMKGKELDEFVARVKERFGTGSLLKRLKSQYYSRGVITNRFGRVIGIDEPIDRIFINYYAQSTGADVALLGFNDLLNRLKASAPSVRPLFVLHDAIVLDVPEEHMEAVTNIKSLNVRGYDVEWPVKVDINFTDNE